MARAGRDDQHTLVLRVAVDDKPVPRRSRIEAGNRPHRIATQPWQPGRDVALVHLLDLIGSCGQPLGIRARGLLVGLGRHLNATGRPIDRRKAVEPDEMGDRVLWSPEFPNEHRHLAELLEALADRKPDLILAVDREDLAPLHK